MFIHVEHLSKHCSSPSIGTVTAIPTAIVVDYFVKHKLSRAVVYVGKWWKEATYTYMDTHALPPHTQLILRHPSALYPIRLT